MQTVKKYSAVAILLAVAIAHVLMPLPAQAFGGGITDGMNSARGADQPADLFGQAGVFSTITNIMLFVIGAVSVIMIIIGGLRYVVSGGDSANVTAAKNTILYAIVGIIVALLSYAIVQFVIGSFVDGGGSFSTGSTGGGAATSF